MVNEKELTMSNAEHSQYLLVLKQLDAYEDGSKWEAFHKLYDENWALLKKGDAFDKQKKDKKN